MINELFLWVLFRDPLPDSLQGWQKVLEKRDLAEMEKPAGEPLNTEEMELGEAAAKGEDAGKTMGEEGNLF